MPEESFCAIVACYVYLAVPRWHILADVMHGTKHSALVLPTGPAGFSLWHSKGNLHSTIIGALICNTRTHADTNNTLLPARYTNYASHAATHVDTVAAVQQGAHNQDMHKKPAQIPRYATSCVRHQPECYSPPPALAAASALHTARCCGQCCLEQSLQQ